MNLPAEYIKRMKADLGDEAEAFFATYQNPAVRGVRANTLKISAERFKEISPFSLEPVPWEESGFYVLSEKPGKTILHAAGVYYVQEPSAMCAAPMLGVKGGERVLDICSAPGGKGTQLAQKMGGEGIIYLNEINFSRAKILSSNVERLGIKNAVVTCASPEKLASSLGAAFDKILVDAPCSGEGMFRKDEDAVSEWSAANVAMCAARQKDILECALSLLAPGGELVYSTCTFSKAEDEEQTARLLSSHPELTFLEERKLYPHKERGEGHYAAHFRKAEGERESIRTIAPKPDKKAAALFEEFMKNYLNVRFSRLHSVGERLYSLPEGYFESGAQVLRAGVHLGDMVNGRFEPSHSLAMCLKEGEATFIPLGEEEAISFLRGNTFECDLPCKGWAVASYLGFPLGWCKLSGGIAKNHIPKGLRI